MRLMDILLVVIASISSILIIYSIIVHILLPKLRRSPGQFIIMIQACQLIIDLTLIVSCLFPEENELLLKHCEIFSGVFSSTILFSISTSLCLKTEIYIQIHASVSTSYTKRNKLYYFFITLITLLFEALLISTQSLGSDEFSYCFVKNKSTGEYLIYSYLTLDTLFTWILILYVKLKKNTTISVNLKKFINLLLAVCLLVSTLVVLLFVNMFYKNLLLRIFATIFLMTGVNLGTIYRVFDSSIFRELKWKFFRNRMKKIARENSSFTEGSQIASRLLVDLRNEGIDLREGLEKKNLLVRII